MLFDRGIGNPALTMEIQEKYLSRRAVQSMTPAAHMPPTEEEEMAMDVLD